MIRSRKWVLLAALSVACGGISARRTERGHGGQAGNETGGLEAGGTTPGGTVSGGTSSSGATGGTNAAGGTSSGGTISPGTGGFPTSDAGVPAACSSPLDPGCAACCEPYDPWGCRIRSSAGGAYYDQYEITEWDCVPECPNCNLCESYDATVETIIYYPNYCRADCDCRTVDRNGDPCFDSNSCGCFCTIVLHNLGNCRDTFDLCGF